MASLRRLRRRLAQWDRWGMHYPEGVAPPAHLRAYNRQVAEEYRRIPTYFCPTSGEVEHPENGGFDVCCDRPDQHRPMTTEEEEA